MKHKPQDKKDIKEKINITCNEINIVSRYLIMKKYIWNQENLKYQVHVGSNG